MEFPGRPRRPVVSMASLLGEGAVCAFPAWFVQDVNRLLADPEIYGFAHGVGQLCRFVPYKVPSKQQAEGMAALQAWAQALPPYWMQQIVHAFFHELDEVLEGVSLLSPERPLHQRDVQYRRDGLESVAAMCHLFEGPFLEFELLRVDEGMRATYLSRAIRLLPADSVEAKRLALTRVHQPHAWWAGP